MWWAYSAPPPVEKELTDLPKSGGGGMHVPPAPLAPASLQLVDSLNLNVNFPIMDD